MASKRVACLYRVSTKKQLDDVNVNDIPMQRKACMEFVEKHEDWHIVKEYTEAGVSGYKTKTADREQIVQAKLDAERGLFDVLLVYMFDRLGRRQEETPFILEYFDKLGVEVWSVMEGRQSFEQHVDSLINFIRFWQAEGESKKTSARVDTKHRQMVEEGQFRGGNIPFGYKAVPSGQYNKDGKELSKLVVDEEQADVVRLIFDLATNYGYGSRRISSYLIQNGYGTNWRNSTIHYMLQNPIYAGYMSYYKTTKKQGDFHTISPDDWVLSQQPDPELVIISKETYDKAQSMRQSRSRYNKTTNHVNTPSKSQLLLTGFIYCGYCGGKLSVKHKYIYNKDGRRDKIMYQCLNKVNKGSAYCSGQTIYSQSKIETPVLKEVFNYINQLKDVSPDKENNPLSTAIQTLGDRINRLNKQNDKNYQILASLRKEIGLALIGESKFDVDTLSQAIADKEAEIRDIKSQLDQLYPELENYKTRLNNADEVASIAYTWEEKFQMADIATQKAMLAMILDKVVVYRDKIDITFNLDIEKYMGIAGGDTQTKMVLNSSSCPPN